MAVTPLCAATGTLVWPLPLSPHASTEPDGAAFTVSTAGGALVTLPPALLTTTV